MHELQIEGDASTHDSVLCRVLTGPHTAPFPEGNSVMRSCLERTPLSPQDPAGMHAVHSLHICDTTQSTSAAADGDGVGERDCDRTGE